MAKEMRNLPGISTVCSGARRGAARGTEQSVCLCPWGAVCRSVSLGRGLCPWGAVCQSVSLGRGLLRFLRPGSPFASHSIHGLLCLMLDVIRPPHFGE